MYQLFLDDLRMPPKDGRKWIIARSMADAIHCIDTLGMPCHISFDHDLGEGINNAHVPSGKDFANWLVDYIIDHEYTAIPFTWQVHSANPIGADNIRKLLDGFEREYFGDQ